MSDLPCSTSGLASNERANNPSAGDGRRPPARRTYGLGFPVLLGVVLASTTYFFATHSIADPDIWWHLRNAETLVQTGKIVSRDTYSFTAAGAPWMNHEWLTELPYYAAWPWLGIRGLYLVLLGCVELVLMGIYYLSFQASRNIKAAFLASWVAVLLATISFGPRTLLFGWIYLVVELVVFCEFREGKDRTWLLPPLFLLWVNSHGSWMIGMVFFLVFIISGLFQGQWGRIEAIPWTRRQLSGLVLVFALSLSALFVNPYGYHLVLYPFNLAFRQTLNISHITEWRSLDFHAIRGKIVFLLLAATIVFALVRKRRWRLDEVAFLLIGFYSALTYTRFLFLAAIVLTPILASELGFLPPYRPELDRPAWNAIIVALILAVCVWRFPSREFLMADTVASYPVKALPYLQHFHPDGRVFNDLLWGGYLIWNTRQIPVFADSRVDIFEYTGAFGDYLDAAGIERTAEVFEKYNIRYVLFSAHTPLSYLLQHDSGWAVRYHDDTTILFERIAAAP
jgi:hypothetical protein